MEVLDINRDLIKLVTTDTYCAPYDFIAGASRNTWVGGNCAIRLCEHMKVELLEAASQLLNVPPKMILMENGFFITSDGNQKATRKEVIHYGCFKMKKEVYNYRKIFF